MVVVKVVKVEVVVVGYARFLALSGTYLPLLVTSNRPTNIDNPNPEIFVISSAGFGASPFTMLRSGY